MREKKNENNPFVPGMLTNIMDIKILICYLLDCVGEPMDKEEMIEMMFKNDVAEYFDWRAAVMELVENGILEGPEAEETVRKSLQPLLDAGADRIVLGCTHYPFLKPVIASIAGPGVQIIDPAPAVARQTVRMLEKDCIPMDEGPFSIDLYFSGEPDSLRRVFSIL